MRAVIKFFRSLFGLKPKPYLIDNKYKIIPAFEYKGETYYMHEDPMNTCAGRGLTSMVYLDELLMRCDIDFLKTYIAARNKVYAQPKINIHALAKLDNILDERLNFLVAIPDHLYKLASVVFFTKDESPFRYDFNIGNKRIKEWKEEGDGAMYDFFLQTPLKVYIASLELEASDIQTSLSFQKKIIDIQLQAMHEILYSGESTKGIVN